MNIQPLNNNLSATYSTPTTPVGNRPQEQAKAAPSPSRVSAEQQQADAKKMKPEEQAQALQDASRKANQAVAGLRSDLQFSVDDTTGSNVVKVVDVKTKEVIRQIPAQEMLVIAKRLDELQGLLIKEQA